MRLENSPQKKPTESKVFIISLVVFMLSLLALDLYVASGRTHDPDALAKFACSIRPYLSLANIAFSHEVVSYATAQCGQEKVSEPVFSIIIMMLKLNIVLVSMIPYWICVMLWPSKLRESQPIVFARLHQKNGVLEHLKTIGGIAIFFIVASMACLWNVSFISDPSKYPIGRYYFKDLENFACVLLWLGSVLVSTNLYYLYVYMQQKVKKT